MKPHMAWTHMLPNHANPGPLAREWAELEERCEAMDEMTADHRDEVYEANLAELREICDPYIPIAKWNGDLVLVEIQTRDTPHAWSENKGYVRGIHIAAYVPAEDTDTGDAYWCLRDLRRNLTTTIPDHIDHPDMFGHDGVYTLRCGMPYYMLPGVPIMTPGEIEHAITATIIDGLHYCEGGCEKYFAGEYNMHVVDRCETWCDECFREARERNDICAGCHHTSCTCESAEECECGTCGEPGCATCADCTCGDASSSEEFRGMSHEEKKAALDQRISTVLAEVNPNLPVYKPR